MKQDIMAHSRYCNDPELNAKQAELIETVAVNEFEENCKLGIKLMIRFKQLSDELNKQMYFITIRPNEKLITFHKFYELVSKYIARNCFIDWKLTFEQKGDDDKSLGTGFHVHILSHMSQRSIGEVLRDTKSTFKHCTAENCIDVKKFTDKNSVDQITSYITEYTSKDGHKIVTRKWDEKWRKTMDLKDLYENETLPPSSPVVAMTYKDIHISLS